MSQILSKITFVYCINMLHFYLQTTTLILQSESSERDTQSCALFHLELLRRKFWNCCCQLSPSSLPCKQQRKSENVCAKLKKKSFQRLIRGRIKKELIYRLQCANSKQWYISFGLEKLKVSLVLVFVLKLRFEATQTSHILFTNFCLQL